MSTSIRNAMKRDNDELYTPKILVDVIMPFVKNYIDAIYGNWYPGKPIPRIWCPFDKENSEFVIALKEKFGKDAYHFSSFDEIETFLLGRCVAGDLLITMGAGDVIKIGENLLGR